MVTCIPQIKKKTKDFGYLFMHCWRHCSVPVCCCTHRTFGKSHLLVNTVFPISNTDCVEAAKVASKKLPLRVETLRGRTEARLSSEGRGVGVRREGNAGKEMKDWEGEKWEDGDREKTERENRGRNKERECEMEDFFPLLWCSPAKSKLKTTLFIIPGN